MLHRTYAKSGDNADLKAIANDMVPLIEGHLKTIKNIQAAAPKP
jgi:hypothetical protein